MFERIKNEVLNVHMRDGITSHIGIEFEEVTPNYIKASFAFDEKVKNYYGSVHGGVLYSAADTVTGSLACMCGKFCSTVSGNINYLLPAVSREKIYLYATIIRDGAHLVVTEVEIKNDDGQLLDTGTFTFYKSDIEIIKDGE